LIQKVRSFAKINLYLYVVSRRQDGYHNLCSLMTRIDLADDMRFDFSAGTVNVSCEHPDVPEDESNLACKAANLFFDAAKGKIGRSGVAIDIVKRIPVGGGLGGGSSNAAATLISLNQFHGNLFSPSELMVLGLSLGADVPFFISGRPAIARGVGEKLENVEKLDFCHLVLCTPDVHAVTADVYKNIDFRLTKKPVYIKSTGLNVPIRGQKFDMADQLHNDLEEPACRLYPKIRETREEMASLLGKTVHMTGSGSSLFALYPDLEQARKGYDTLSAHWAGSDKKLFLSSFV
jgi:4-diphosphocytidyl-2-C-methyl-D-erythritol kinase